VIRAIVRPVVMAVALSLCGAALAADAAKADPAGAHKKRSSKMLVTGTANLNNATAAQLDLLPGVGEKAAKEILAYRAKQPFQRVEDLVKVKGFGKKRFEKVKPFISIIGATTIKAQKKEG
jgi:competence protein ComEA